MLEFLYSAVFQIQHFTFKAITKSCSIWYHVTSNVINAPYIQWRVGVQCGQCTRTVTRHVSLIVDLQPPLSAISAKLGHVIM